MRKNDCVYNNGGTCSVLTCKQCEKNGHCTFYQTAEMCDVGRRKWAEKIAAMGMTQRKRYSDLYYGGWLERYVEKVISAEN